MVSNKNASKTTFTTIPAILFDDTHYIRSTLQQYILTKTTEYLIF